MVASHKGKANAVKLLLSQGAKLGLCDQVGKANIVHSVKLYSGTSDRIIVQSLCKGQKYFPQCVGGSVFSMHSHRSLCFNYAR